MKNKKTIKNLSIIFMSGIVVLSAYYYFAIYNSVKVVSAHASYAGFDDVDSLTETADLVLSVTPNDVFENREHIIKKYEDGSIQDFYTFTEVKVNKVFKGNDFDSNTLKLIEPVSLFQTSNGKYKLDMEGYQEMEQGKEYIVFLGKNTFGDYSIINMDNGKFAIEEVINSLLSATENAYSEPSSTNNFPIKKTTESTKEKLEQEIFRKFLN